MAEVECSCSLQAMSNSSVLKYAEKLDRMTLEFRNKGALMLKAFPNRISMR